MVFPLHAITTAPMAWQYVRQHGHPVPALEPLFAEDPYNAYDYALLYKMPSSWGKMPSPDTLDLPTGMPET